MLGIYGAATNLLVLRLGATQIANPIHHWRSRLWIPAGTAAELA